jgi:hypothetical protein
MGPPHTVEAAAVLDDAAEQERVGFGDPVGILEPAVVQAQGETAVAGHVRGQGVGPDRHELGAVVLGIRVDGIGRVNEGDAHRKNPASGGGIQGPRVRPGMFRKSTPYPPLNPEFKGKYGAPVEIRGAGKP